MTEPTDLITDLTSDDVMALYALKQRGHEVAIRHTSEGVQWECQGLISASFPTGKDAIKNLATYSKLGELTT
jgi:hypothetical protein